MSDRLTSEWTETLEEAFGEKGMRGLRGELLAKLILEDYGFRVIHNESDRVQQMAGNDLIILNGDCLFGVDVKANLSSEKTAVCVDKKIMRSKAYFWMHVNLSDPNEFILYATSSMQKCITQNNFPYHKGCWWVPKQTAHRL